MKDNLLVKLFRKDKVKRIIVFLCTFIFIYAVLITSLVAKKYKVEEGDISKVDITAPREVKDRMATEEKIKESVNSVALQYTKKVDVKNKVISDINSFFAQVNQLKGSSLDDNTKLAKLKSGVIINLTDNDYKYLLTLGNEDIKSLQDFLIQTMSDLYDNNNIEEQNGDNDKEAKSSVDKAKESIIVSLNNSKFVDNEKTLAQDIAVVEIKPNFFYDKDKTNQLRKDEQSNVQSVVIKKDQIIVKKGEPITKEQMEILKDLGLLDNDSNNSWYIYVNIGLFVFLILIIEWFYIFRDYNDVYNNCSKIVLINVLTCMGIIIARAINIISPFLIPLVCVPMLLALLINKDISLIISILDCLFISSIVSFNVEITLIAVFDAMLGAIILKKMQQRNDILYTSFCIGIINVALSLSLGFLLSNDVVDILKKAGLLFIGSVISGVLTIGFLPIFESIFDIVTTVKLLELLNPNQPLLKKLLLEVPGTYHHSLLVANLAEAAAEEVGGNVVLTRVCGYYHDIGKIRRPYFFKENQIGSENPHNKITPNLSTLIIISHVKDGIELAKEYKLPKIIQDVIQEHHGTTLVKYFYLMVKNSSEHPTEVNEQNFRYPGPTPSTKESALIMLADGVEAAVRSISEPTKGKIEEMVNNIIQDRLDDGQMDNCDLTFKDIEKIRKSFLKSLMAVYHTRLEYPVDKWENKK